MEQVKNEENKKNVKRVGRVTFGITLVLIGVLIILQLFLDIQIVKYVTMFWPVILIILGIEVIYYSKKEYLDIKYDAAGIILTFIVLIVASIFSLITYGVDKITSYNKDQVINNLVKENYNMSFEKKVEVNNLTDAKINVKKQISSDFDGTYVIANIKFKDYTKTSLIGLINNEYSLYNMIRIDELSSDLSKLNIVNVPDYIDSIDFIITSSSDEMVKLEGNITEVKN